jgi:hypothetical protein
MSGALPRNLDEGAGTVANDSSGNGHNGVIVGGPTWVSGKLGAAIHFDGTDDYIEIPGTSDWNFPLGFTLKASVRFTDFNHDVFVVGKHISGETAGYGLGVLDNRIYFLLNEDPYPRLVTMETYADGNWHDVVGVYDGANQSLYVDGVLKACQTLPYTRFSPANLRIGGYTEGQYAYKFLGDIDEVQFYGVPEPATLSLLALGGAAVMARRKRRK